MEQIKYDWTFFKRRIYVNNSSKKELFRMWATPKGITEWFIEIADYVDQDGKKRKPVEVVSAKDKYTWTFHKGSKTEGEVLEVAEDSLFKFTFGKKDIDSEEDVIVTVTFYEEGDRAWFDVLQANMSNSKFGRVNYHISCNMGWVFHINNLKSIIENGHDLRVKGVERMHVDAPSGYPLEQYEWTMFRQKEYIKAPISEVFIKWVTPGGIIEWFLKKAMYESENEGIRFPIEIIKTGDNYTWKFYSGFIMKGKILDVQENSSFKFTFGKKEPDLDEDVIVNVTFKEKDGLTVIELEQNNIADNEYGKVTYNLSCIVGWSYYLTNLRSIIESGYDFREKDMELAKETTAYSLDN